MRLFDFLNRIFGSTNQPINSQQFRPSRGYEETVVPTVSFASDWYMPKYKGRDICDWVEMVASLKREGNLEQALEIARGCMSAMAQAAQANPANVMEFYVSQVVIIQRKMKDYEGELATLDGWLAMGLPAARQDHRLELEKRRAKARELIAKRNGQDATAFTAEWKRLCELEKQAQASSSGVGTSTGRSTVDPDVPYHYYSQSRSNSSGLVAPKRVLAAPRFVAVDFETANRQSGVSACQIALAKVHHGQVVERFASLIKPPSGFDSFEFTYLHGISARDVRHSPSWLDIATDVDRFVAGMPVYAHNAQFDRKVWSELDSFFGTNTRPAEFYCSYRTAKRLVPGLENYKLPTVTHALVPGFQLNHHEAGSDAEACALIIAALQRLIR